ncbi:MAG TPA: leucyl aminopeptidase [Solirubrobacteraceae bacterium]
MNVTTTTQPPLQSGADTIAVGVFEDEGIAHDVDGGALEALLDRGEARRSFGHLAVSHAGGGRFILVGLGERSAFDAERARRAAATVLGRARELGTQTLCWEVPHHVDDDVAGALVEGTLLANYRFTLFKGGDDDTSARGPGALVLSAHDDLAPAAARAAALAGAQNAARDLQNRPANDLTPTALADEARRLAGAIAGLEVEVLGRAEIEARGMGAFAAVFRGSDQEPALIVLRYAHPEPRGPVLGMVGKAVTFDSGGLTIKTGPGMVEMKFDMSGGAAVLEAAALVARRELPVRLVAVIGATDNVISGRSIKPGDIVSAADGTTIEINNTDAEGRLVLADCILHARELGAERLVDLATLTGGVVTALGSVYAGVMSNDDAWCAAVTAAGDAAGEPVWRLPLHPRYAEAIEGVYADITNTGRDRKAHPLMGAEFLHRFAGDVPWAHLDIAGVANDNGLPYTGKGGAGWGVRLLVTLTESLAAGPS